MAKNSGKRNKLIKSTIGIISYLPDDEEVRKVRLDRCLNLIKKCSEMFELPIILIAQNGKIEEVKKIQCSTTVTLKCYNKLGITKAREVLRRVFLETDEDYLICFDDDFELTDDKKVYTKFLKRLDGKHFYEYANFLMNHLTLPRDILELEPFDLDVSAEDGTGYEDGIYVMNLKDKYGDRYEKIEDLQLCIKDRHTMTLDKYSTGKLGEQQDQTDISLKKIKTNMIMARLGKSNEKS